MWLWRTLGIVGVKRMNLVKIRVNAQFVDSKTGKLRRPGEIIEVTSLARAKKIISSRLGTLIEITSTWFQTTKQPKILVYISLLASIGGIETAIKNMAKAFPDRNFCFIVKNYDNIESIFELGERFSVIIDEPGMRYKGDILFIMNFDGADYLGDRAEVKKAYEFCHCDWNGLIEVGTKLKLAKYPGAKYVTVSETCKKGLKDVWGEDSVIVPNILNKVDTSKTVTFLFMSRATCEKGVDTMLDMLNEFDEEGRDYIALVCSQIYQATPEIQRRLTANDRIINIPASRYARKLLKSADYLVQLSATESYCYAVREALSVGVPCIVSDIPELKKVVKDGENGYVLKRDLSNLDSDKIFNNIPKPKPYVEKISPKWEKLLDGTL